MNSQEKKHYLQRYGKLNKAINQKLHEYESVRSLCEKITTTLSDMPKGGNGTKEDIYIKLADIKDEIDAEVDKYADMRGDIEKTIDTVDDESLQALLRFRYINEFTWERISVEMKYDIDGKNVYKLHGKALAMLKLDTLLHL